MQKTNERTFPLTPSESLKIERLHYITDSYQKFICILAKSFSEFPSEEGKEMIEHYRPLFQKSLIELQVAQKALFASLFEKVPEHLEFTFDFERAEVNCRW